MCFTTFFTQKQIMKRSGPVEGQAATVQRLMLYGMPLSLFVSGFFFPIGVLLYWFTNNLWTLGQQFFILRKMPPPGSPPRKAKAAADKPAVDPKHAGAQARRQAGPPEARSPGAAAPASTVDADGARSTSRPPARRRRPLPTPTVAAAAAAGPTARRRQRHRRRRRRPRRAGPANRGKRKRR